jgi:hypothetical protein
MEENRVPLHFRERVRKYLEHAKRLIRTKHYASVIDLLCPSIQRELAWQSHGQWASKIEIFNAKDAGERQKFLTGLAMIMEQDARAPQDIIFSPGEYASSMFVVVKGVVVLSHTERTTFKTHGRMSSFGEEMLLAEGRRLRTAVSLTFLDVMVLHKAPFDEMLEEFWDVFPQTRKLIRRAVLKLGLRQAMYSISMKASIYSTTPPYPPLTHSPM